jgi:hypothetical protein
MNKPQRPKDFVARNFDPKDLKGRLYNQVDRLLDQLETGEHITLKERVAALIAVGRLQLIFVGLRKEKTDEPDRGSAVRKYASAFAANDSRRRAASARPAAIAAADADLAGGLDGSDDAFDPDFDPEGDAA